MKQVMRDPVADVVSPIRKTGVGFGVGGKAGSETLRSRAGRARQRLRPRQSSSALEIAYLLERNGLTHVVEGVLRTQPQATQELGALVPSSLSRAWVSAIDDKSPGSP